MKTTYRKFGPMWVIKFVAITTTVILSIPLIAFFTQAFFGMLVGISLLEFMDWELLQVFYINFFQNIIWSAGTLIIYGFLLLAYALTTINSNMWLDNEFENSAYQGLKKLGFKLCKYGLMKEVGNRKIMIGHISHINGDDGLYYLEAKKIQTGITGKFIHFNEFIAKSDADKNRSFFISKTYNRVYEILDNESRLYGLYS